MTEESTKLQSDIRQRRDLLSKLVSEGAVVQEETKKAWRVNQKLKNQMQEFEVPNVMEYVSVKVRFIPYPRPSLSIFLPPTTTTPPR